jgi:hypothetical protein
MDFEVVTALCCLGIRSTVGAFVTMVMNLQVIKKLRIFLPAEKLSALGERLCIVLLVS